MPKEFPGKTVSEVKTASTGGLTIPVRTTSITSRPRKVNSRVSSGTKDKDILEDETEEFRRQLSKSVAPVQEFVVLPHSNVCSVGMRSRFCWALANNCVGCRVKSGHHHPQLELHPETLSLNRDWVTTAHDDLKSSNWNIRA